MCLLQLSERIPTFATPFIAWAMALLDRNVCEHKHILMR